MTKEAKITKQSRESQTIIPVELIEKKIYLIRSHKVMLDSDLAELYGVETRVVLQSVKRNITRFPEDFMFQLTKEEFANLRSQIVTSYTPPLGEQDTPQSYKYGYLHLALGYLSSIEFERKFYQNNYQEAA